jgi:hypothetical protein
MNSHNKLNNCKPDLLLYRRPLHNIASPWLLRLVYKEAYFLHNNLHKHQQFCASTLTPTLTAISCTIIKPPPAAQKLRPRHLDTSYQQLPTRLVYKKISKGLKHAKTKV